MLHNFPANWKRPMYLMIHLNLLAKGETLLQFLTSRDFLYLIDVSIFDDLRQPVSDCSQAIPVCTAESVRQ